MRTVHPPERLPFNEWFAYIQREIISDRIKNLNHYEQNHHSQTPFQNHTRRDRQGITGRHGIEDVDFVEVEKY
jgi:hypothetical protein